MVNGGPPNLRYGQTIAVVGAGATGALTALQLMRHAAAAGTTVDIRLVDPSRSTGRGLAYSTADERHLLNVPAGRMSALPAEPDHFLSWLSREHGVDDPTAFVPRAWFGEYLEQTLLAEAATSTCSLRRVREDVVEVHPRAEEFTLRLSGGSRFRASHIVLAMGNPGTDRSWVPTALHGTTQFVPDVWNETELRAATEGAREILIVGSGLTMVDMALSLAEPWRRIHVVSRSGLLPSGHLVGVGSMPPPALPEGSMTLTEVRALVERQLARAVADGLDWRAGFDSLRPVTNDLWQRLNRAERVEFLARDVRTWDVHRHRMPPSSARRIHGLIESGQLRTRRAGVADAQLVDGGIEVTLSDGDCLTVDAVLDCTGPSTISAGTGSGALLLDSLVRAGLVRLHDLGLGLDVDADGHVINDSGRTDPHMYVVGPLRRGQLWETTAIPEIRVQASEVAEAIIQQRPSPAPTPRTDLYGLELTADADVVDLYNEALGRLLRVQSGARESLLECVRRDPDFAMAHAALALVGNEFDAEVNIAAHLYAAQTAAMKRGTERERAFVAAAVSRVAGDSARLRAHLREYPRDVLAVSVCMPTIAFSGAYDVPEDAWNELDSLASEFGTDDWWYNGLSAFAKQERGDLATAEQLADRSLEVEPRGGTAVHARAHVYYEVGEHEAGLTWIDPWIESCGRDAIHRAHFSWHAALHELALNDEGAVCQRYERQLAPPAVSGTRALVDSAALLWRMRVHGMKVDDAAITRVWAAAGRALDHPATPFAAMHAALALAVGGDSADVARFACRCRSAGNPVTATVVAEFADALADFLAGRNEAAAVSLLALRQQFDRVGGSAAQQEIVEETAIAALAAAGRSSEATALLEERMDRRPRPRDESWRAGILVHSD